MGQIAMAPKDEIACAMDDRNKVVEMIDVFRSRLADLRSPFFVNSEVFAQSSQAAVFIFSNPSLSPLIFRSNPTREDREVRIYCDVPLSQAIDRFPDAVKHDENEGIRKFAGSEEEISLAQLYTDAFLSFLGS
jgi:hypothetical protein